MALKYSKQRTVILDFIKGRKDHPTADVVYANVRKTLPNISLGTVYRNLVLLADLGEIRKVRIGDGIDHFDPVTDDHDHFVCNCCGAVYDIPASETVSLEKITPKNAPGKVTGHTLVYNGICHTCANSNQQAI